jgi:UDP-2,3-diacylglucosamine hydrolase
MTYFPSQFDATQPIALLAGKGLYPYLAWKEMCKRCPHAFVISFEPNEWLEKGVSPESHYSVSIGQVGSWLKILKQKRTRYVMLAGQVTPKKLFHGLNPDLKAVFLLAKLKERNATTIFSALIHEIEKLGIVILDARCFMDPHIVSLGDLTHENKRKVDRDELIWGINTCRTIADLNIGQGLIVSRGTVIIAEAFDGTDAMIERAGTICSRPMGLIKLAKKTQDFRYDVPVFGMHTLQEMHKSGVVWAALESERSIILDKPQVITEADRLKIRILGF